MVVTLPVASFDVKDYLRAEPGIHGLVDLVGWQVLRWNKKGVETVPLPRTTSELVATNVFPAGHKLPEEILKAREALLDALCEDSDDLMTRLTASTSPSPYLELPAQDILKAMRSLVLQQKILPVFCGSAFKNVGTSLLMSYIGELLASPVDVRRKDDEGDEHPKMLAWKVAFDQKKGWTTFVRVYSGRSSNRNKTIDNKFKEL